MLRLVPHLVHKLNNSLSVLTGAVEIAARSDFLPARSELQRMSETLRSLSWFARAPRKHRELFELGSVLRGVEMLVGPFANARGVDLEVSCPRSPAVLHADPPRLLQLLTTLVAQEITSVASDFRATFLDPENLEPQPTVRLALRVNGKRLAVTLVRPAPRDPSPPLSPVVQVALASAGEWGMRVLLRTWNGRTAYRFVFEGVGGGESEAPTERPEPRRASLVVVMREAGDRGLIHTVLAEAGFRVARRSELGTGFRAEEADLILLEASQVSLLPGLDGGPEAGGLRRRVLLLGETDHPSARPLPCLPEPFRPQELILAVEELLTSGGQPQSASSD